MDVREAAALLIWRREQVVTAIEDGVQLPISQERITLVATRVGTGYDIDDESLDEFLTAFEEEEPGRHPPVRVRRALLVESSHNCGVCGESAPLHFHHILGFAQLKHHDATHMLAVCGRCHDKIHLGQIDYKAQLDYKRRLLGSSSATIPVDQASVPATDSDSQRSPVEYDGPMHFTPEIVQWLHAAGYEYHCFISWPRTPNPALAECAERVKEAIEQELSLLFPNPRVYFAQTDVEDEAQWQELIGQILCKSIVMVAICAPVYYYPDFWRCGLEWAAMEVLSEARLPGRSLKAIIPAFVRKQAYLPRAVQEISDLHIDMSGVATSGRRYYNTQDFRRQIIKICRHIEEISLEVVQSGSLVDCEDFRLPAESAFSDFSPRRQSFPFRS